MRVWVRALTVLLTLVALGLGGFTFSLIKTASPQEVITDFSGKSEMTFLTIGDQGVGNLRQWRVADAMERYAAKNSVHAVFLLGDNFYRHGVESPEDIQWSYKFENVYTGALSATPFFATLGNHDYYGNEMAQIKYSQEKVGSGRWQMPARDYLWAFGGDRWQPLLRVVFIDTGLYLRNPEDAATQLDRLLSSASPAVWTLVVTHAPFVSGNVLAHWPGSVDEIWQPLLKRHRVDAVIAGHDHNMQLIDRNGWPTSMIVGVGGKSGQALELGGPEEIPGLEFFVIQTGFGVIKVSRKGLALQFFSIEDQLLFEHQLTK